MKIVIDISEETYEVVCRVGSGAPFVIDNAIQNGTPLPKGHGRLIDADAFQDRLTRQRWTFRDVKEYKEMMLRINDEPTIIEADKEGSGDA